jgi:hypothetical protein
MIKKEVINLNGILNSVNVVKGNLQLAYAIVKNIGILKADVTALETISKEYTEKRDALIKDHYKKDDKGKILLKDKKPVFDEERLKESLKIFNEENKEFVESYTKILEEEVNLDLYKVPISAFEGLYVIENDNNHLDYYHSQ